MLQLFSKSRTLCCYKLAGPYWTSGMHIFLGSEIKKIVFKVFLYVIVWWVYHFFFQAGFPSFPSVSVDVANMALSIWPWLLQKLLLFSATNHSVKGAAGWAVWRAPPPEEGRYLKYLWFLTLNLSQVRSGVAPLQQPGLSQYQRIQIMLISVKNISNCAVCSELINSLYNLNHFHPRTVHAIPAVTYKGLWRRGLVVTLKHL